MFTTPQKVIAEVDTEEWWHDVQERQWVVKKPCPSKSIRSRDAEVDQAGNHRRETTMRTSTSTRRAAVSLTLGLPVVSVTTVGSPSR